jgi:site-specific DNA recombinase
MRVLGYTRLSSARREESTSIVRQREVIASTATARGWTLVDTIDDVDVSASKRRLDRPGLHEIRRRIKAGEADAVLVWRLDRLVRSVADVGILLDEGLQVVSATEPLDTTSNMGRAMVEVLQVFAGMEARAIAERVASSREYLQRVGRYGGGSVPYGYRVADHPDGVGKALEPDPATAAVVRRMVDEALAGRSIYALAAALNDDGVPSPRGGRWHPAVIRRILRDGSILGRQRRHDEIIRDPVTGLPVVFWEPLVSVSEVERIRAATEWTPRPGRGEAILEGRRGKRGRLLSGLLFCPSCGSRLTIRTYAGAPERTAYACSARSRGLACERGTTVQARLIEPVVEERFLAIAGRFPVVEPHVEIREVAGLAALDESIRVTSAALGSATADEFPVLLERLTLLRARRAELSEVPLEPVVEMRETGRTFGEVWAEADTAARRDLLESSGVEITLAPHSGARGTWDPARVAVEWPREDYLAGEDLS